MIRAMLAGRGLVDLDEDFEIERSLPHGHVAAVLGVLREPGPGAAARRGSAAGSGIWSSR